MNFLHRPQKIRTDLFGCGDIVRGHAVSWYDDPSCEVGGYAVPYNGENILGLSADRVVHIDAFRYNQLPPACVIDGGKIRIVEEGEIVWPAKKKWQSGNEITIGKYGQIKRAKQAHKAYGIIKSIDADRWALIYFRVWGL